MEPAEPAPELQGNRCLTAALKQKIDKIVYEAWKKAWRENKNGRDLYQIVQEPTRKVMNLHQSTSRAYSSLIIQMRTGKIGLRQFLHQRGVPGFDSGTCDCNQGQQTVKHVLLVCRTHKDLRLTFQTRGNGRSHWTTNLKAMLSNRATAIKAAQFMIATRLLGQFGAIPDAEQNE